MDFKKIIAFDTETTGLNVYKGDRPFCISFTDQDMNDMYYRWNYNTLTREVSLPDHVRIDIQNILNDEDILYIAHNAKFDVAMLESVGIYFSKNITVWDTVVLAHIENNARHTYKLKPLCKKLFDFSDEDEKDLKSSVIHQRKIGKKMGWMLSEDVEGDYALADKSLCEKYAVGDTQRCMLLFKYLMKSINLQNDSENSIKMYKMEMELMKVLMSMEKKGICIDKERAKEIECYYDNIIEKGKQTKIDLGFDKLNTRSPKQMAEVFYNVMDAKPIYKMSKNSNGVKQKKLTTDKNALNKWAETNDLAKAIVDINIAEHELGSFIKPLQFLCDVNGRVHPNYKQTGAVTGRLSCTNPNLQNISNVKEGVKGRVNLRARELFVPAQGYVLYFPDYSQVEVWVSAFTSKDPLLCEGLTKGLDIHRMLAEKTYGHKEDYIQKKDIYRKRAKMGIFCVIYGGGVDALCNALGCTKLEANEFLDTFRATYKGLNQYGKDLMYVAKEFGYIENPFGRKYYINEDTAYKALNYMIQGSASDIMKMALINVHKLLRFKLGCNLLLTIHDELCIEVPKRLHSEKLMKEIITAMQGDFHTYFGMPKPFEVSMAWTDTRWSEKKEIKL